MNVIYSLPYILLFFMCMLLASTAQKRNRVHYVIILISVLTVFAGLRADSVGIDTSTYITNLSNGYYKLYEIGFQKLSSFFEDGRNVEIYLMVIGAIIYTLIIMRLWELRNIANFPFSVFLFLIMHFAPSMNTMRQYLACAIVFWGTRFLFSKKVILYLICILIAMTFHRTAIIGAGFLLIYFLYWKQMRVYQKLASIAFLMILPIGLYYIYVFELRSYVFARMEYYFSNQGDTGLFIYLQIFTIICVYFLSRNYRLRMSYEGRRVCNIALFFALLGLIISLIGYYVLFMGRIALYFELFTVVFYAIIWRATVVQSSGETVRRSGTVILSQNALVQRTMILFITVFPFIMQIVNNSYKILPYVLR